ncbi:MAG: hypothetical protein R2748_17155 [Bryobacterales bacterium]
MKGQILVHQKLGEEAKLHFVDFDSPPGLSADCPTDRFEVPLGIEIIFRKQGNSTEKSIFSFC